MSVCGRNVNTRSAVVLVAVLWTVALITMIVVVVARSSLLDTRISMSTAENVRGRWACRAGLEQAIAVLAEDDASVDSYADYWYENPADFNDVPLDMCAFNVQVVDECSKLNINTATKEQLIWLPYMTEEIADSIIDWRDSDEEVSIAGAEAGYYLDLEHGYMPRNGEFKTLDEVLLVQGVDEELFYDVAGWDGMLTCYSAAGGGSSSTSLEAETTEGQSAELVNINQGNEQQLMSQLSLGRGHARWIVENRQFDSLSKLLANNSPDQPQGGVENSNQAMPLDRQTFFGLLGRITLGQNDDQGAGKVNINTASEDVLLAVFEGDETLVSEVLSLRSGSEEGFTSLGGLADAGSFTNEKVRKFVDRLTVNSSVFKVISEAVLETTGTKRQMTAVVDRSESPAKVVYYYEGFAR